MTTLRLTLCLSLFGLVAAAGMLLAARWLGEQRQRDWLAYINNVPARQGLYVADLSSRLIIRVRDLMPVNAGMCAEVSLDWSNDGRLAFTQYCDDTLNYEVMMLDFNTGHVRNLTQHPERDLWPAWSKDGRIAFLSSRSRSRLEGLYIADVATGALRLVSNELYVISHPVWSKDGRIAFAAQTTRGPNIFVREVDGRVVPISQQPRNVEPAWSAAGQLAYLHFEGNRSSLYVHDWTTGVGASIPGDPERAANPVWSPDGRLTFTGWYDGAADIYTLDAATGERTNLTDHSGYEALATWSNDGRLAFVADWEDNFGLYVLTVKTGAVVRIDGPLGSPLDLDWAQ